MLIDRTDDPLIRLLVDPTRRADCTGPALARAHREVGRALASSIAASVPIEEEAIEHVAGRSAGIRVQRGAEPIIIAMMRAGLFVAEGLWECFPGASLVPHHPKHGELPECPIAGRTVVIVDAVINTGASLQRVLDAVGPFGPARVYVVTLVGYRSTVEKLATDTPLVDFLAARLSDRTYVGRGTTDTGARLFGTTNWASER